MLAENFGMSIYIEKDVVCLRQYYLFSLEIRKLKSRLDKKPRIKVREGILKCH